MIDYIAFCFKLPAFFQIGHPIYSSKMVRFRMGHCKLPRRSESFITDDDDNQAVIADENYIWTYTSPEFLMFQVISCLLPSC